MTIKEIKTLLILSIIFLELIIVMYFAYQEKKSVEEFKIPLDYSLVKYDNDNFVIMDSARTKFLVYWNDESYSMEEDIGNLKGSEIKLKKHLIKYLEQLKKQNEKQKIQEQLKMK